MADTRPDYEAFYDAFKPADLSAEFDGSFTTGLNACIECVDPVSYTHLTLPTN